jgi:ribosome production factor 1
MGQRKLQKEYRKGGKVETSVSTEAPALEPETSGPVEPKASGRDLQVNNKIRRRGLFETLKKEKKKDKRKRQDVRKKRAQVLGEDAPPKLVPKTIDSMREYDETTVVKSKQNIPKENEPQELTGNEKDLEDKTENIPIEDEEDEEVNWDLSNDQFKDYFSKIYEPKVLITSGDNPHSKTISFVKEMTRVVPNASPFWRKNSSIKKMVKQAIANKYTDIVIVNEDNRVPNGLVISHLPDGPTAHFKLSNVKVTSMIKKNYKAITAHRPEVILNGFTTRLGHTVARMLASIFHYDPQFHGKRAVTFHCQRDYIFLRHHKYEFKSTEKVKLRELGPRFTLKLRSLQKGTFDSKTGEYDWIISNKRHELETGSRRRFYL